VRILEVQQKLKGRGLRRPLAKRTSVVEDKTVGRSESSNIFFEKVIDYRKYV
jgi:hypothetical protein